LISSIIWTGVATGALKFIYNQILTNPFYFIFKKYSVFIGIFTYTLSSLDSLLSTNF
jgi:hypothetical protein